MALHSRRGGGRRCDDLGPTPRPAGALCRGSKAVLQPSAGMYRDCGDRGGPGARGDNEVTIGMLWRLVCVFLQDLCRRLCPALAQSPPHRRPRPPQAAKAPAAFHNRIQETLS